LAEWKENHNETAYRTAFAELLAKLDVKAVSSELSDIANGSDIVLLCYERKSDFCHRHLVAEWFRKNGIPCEECE
jgi:uncharacterized protein YeaO (DUF488 family)